jgi:hypothetical protein
MTSADGLFSNTITHRSNSMTCGVGVVRFSARSDRTTQYSLSSPGQCRS